MKIVRNILIISAGLLLLLFIIGLFLPSEYKIERQITINSVPDSIIPFIMNLSNWEKWSYISTKKDSTLKLTFKDSKFGSNSQLFWKSDYMGTGKVIINDYKTNERIGYDMIFGEDDHKINGLFLFKASNNQTKVTWMDYGELGFNPVARIFGLFLDGFIGKDLELSLSNLKKTVETK